MRILKLIAILLLVAAATGCDRVNNKSLPEYPVRINLGDYGRWVTYGVSGAAEYRTFSRERREPSNFPYDSNTYTGFGGVLLMMGVDMVPMAYDMACPVEARTDVVIHIDSENFDAVCPQCHSRYNVLTGRGTSMSGMAYERKLGLRVYAVSPYNGGYIISNR